MNQGFGIVLIIVLLTLLNGCQKTSKVSLSNSQKEIIRLYATDYLLNEDQYLYYKTEEKDQLLRVLELPLESEDFLLSNLNTVPSENQEIVNTLFDNKELLNWSKQVAKYEQKEWDGNLLPDKVKLIHEDKIPEYLNLTDIPLPGNDPIFIHYITQPFIYGDSSAIVYSRKWSSPANVRITYHHFAKKNNTWRLKSKGHLTAGY